MRWRPTTTHRVELPRVIKPEPSQPSQPSHAPRALHIGSPGKKGPPQIKRHANGEGGTVPEYLSEKKREGARKDAEAAAFMREGVRQSEPWREAKPDGRGRATTSTRSAPMSSRTLSPALSRWPCRSASWRGSAARQARRRGRTELAMVLGVSSQNRSHLEGFNDSSTPGGRTIWACSRRRVDGWRAIHAPPTRAGWTTRARASDGAYWAG